MSLQFLLTRNCRGKEVVLMVAYADMFGTLTLCIVCLRLSFDLGQRRGEMR